MVPASLRIIRATVVTFSALIALGACAPGLTNKPMDLESLTGDMERRAQFVRQFQVQFVKTRRGSLFNGDMTVNGHLVLQKPNRFSMTLNGDVNLEVLSDGTTIKMIHDQKDEEIYHIEGERDLARFADPLMAVISGLGNGGLRRFSKINEQRQGDLLMVELEPGKGNSFERIKSLILWFSARGDIKKVKIRFNNGDEEETVFETWSLLTQDSPEILDLDRKLNSISGTTPPQGQERPPSPDLTYAPSNTGRPESSSQLSRRLPRISRTPILRTRVEPTPPAWPRSGPFPGRCPLC